MNQTVAGSGEERREASSGPADKVQQSEEELTLYGVEEDAMCMKSGLGKESLFHILNERIAHVSVK